MIGETKLLNKWIKTAMYKYKYDMVIVQLRPTWARKRVDAAQNTVVAILYWGISVMEHISAVWASTFRWMTYPSVAVVTHHLAVVHMDSHVWTPNTQITFPRFIKKSAGFGLNLSHMEWRYCGLESEEALFHWPDQPLADCWVPWVPAGHPDCPLRLCQWCPVTWCSTRRDC